MSETSQRPGSDAWMFHLYRALAGNETMWRQRLDVTSNWAVPLVLALVTWALSERTLPHLALLVLGWALIGLAALVEARRYRVLHHSAWRTGLIERGFYAPRLDGTADPAGWQAALAEDLRRPTLRLTRWASFRSRFRAMYAVLGYLLTLAWLGKVVIHPTIATSWAQVLERMSVAGLVPPWGILGGALTLVAIATAIALTAVPAQALEADAAEQRERRAPSRSEPRAT